MAMTAKSSARQLFENVVAMARDGAKPFRIAQRVLADPAADGVVLRGTLNDQQLIFRTGETIGFDGKEWHFTAAAAPVRRARPSG